MVAKAPFVSMVPGVFGCSIGDMLFAIDSMIPIRRLILATDPGRET